MTMTEYEKREYAARTPETQAGDEAAVNDERAGVYGLLSRLYYEEVDERLIDEFCETMQVLPLSEDNDELCRLFAQGNNLMVKYLLNRNNDTITQLKCDYAKVFLAAGIYDGRSASPYESVYTGEEHLLMGDARDEIYRLFCQSGIAIQDRYHMPEDHISFELQYMELLCKRVSAAIRAGAAQEVVEEGYAQQRAFLLSHLANWIPAFCDDIEDLARTAFYRGLGRYTRAWLAAEVETLAPDRLDMVWREGGSR